MRKKEKRESITCSDLIKKIKFAAQGFIDAIKSQPYHWLFLAATIAIVSLGLAFNISTTEWLFIFFVYSFILYVKKINPPFERMVELTVSGQQNIAEQAKDLTVGIILISTIASVVVIPRMMLQKIIKKL
ncbi:MAG TPA: diacylglycerol kinase [Bacteroidales bacterium]